MTKTILQIIISLAVFHYCTAQSDLKKSHQPNFIDSINTTTQVTDLILKVDERYKKFTLNDKVEFTENNCQKVSDSLHIRPWTKADFDNNGLTDILVVGKFYDHSIICILDKGDKYEIERITRKYFQGCTFPVVENNKLNYYLEILLDRRNRDRQIKLQQITLLYRFGGFIEENLNPANHSIENIEYSTIGCFGRCPIFHLTINSDRTAKWFANKYSEIDNKEFQGNFQTTITPDKFDEIINLMNYIGFDTLKDDYDVDWSDDQTSTLKITYNNGKTKSIRDYGLVGTYGLSRVYKLLFDLRKNQQWTK